MSETDVQNTQELSTTSEPTETQQGANEATEPDTAPQGGESTEGATATGGDNSNTAEINNAESETPFLEIQYNHEKRGLTKGEAALLAQKGIHFEGAYNAIERVATLKGQSVDDFLKGIETAEDEAYRKGLVDKFGEDEDTINKMMELYTINKEKTLNTAKESRRQAAEQAEQSTNARIAEEFQGMKAEFPELTEFSALPDEVKKAALNGISLEHAYLKYTRSEQKKINAAKAAEAEAAKKTTGSLAGDTTDSQTDEERKFLNALWG